LAPKLEELYLLLNEASEQNARQSKLLYLSVKLDDEAKQKLFEMDELDLYGLSRAKKIIMYIRLYFPNLAQIHQLLFAAEREFNMLKFDIYSEEQPTLADLIMAGGKVGHFLRLMEQEIIRTEMFFCQRMFCQKNTAKQQKTTLATICLRHQMTRLRELTSDHH
jgi:hypothetical protein